MISLKLIARAPRINATRYALVNEKLYNCHYYNVSMIKMQAIFFWKYMKGSVEITLVDELWFTKCCDKGITG